MSIDKSGRWWRGDDFSDLAEYLGELTADGYPARDVRQSICICGGKVFLLEALREEEGARRICVSCGASAFIGDSEEYADEADFDLCRCPCGKDRFEIGVGFSFYDAGDVRWITVGERCVECGVLGSFVDWKVNFSPTDHLLSKV